MGRPAQQELVVRQARQLALHRGTAVGQRGQGGQAGVARDAGARLELRRPGAHTVGLLLQRGVVIDGQPADVQARRHPALRLLHHMPGLMRQVLLLAGRQVDVRALGIGQRAQPGRAGRVVVHFDAVHRQAGQRFDALPQRVRQSFRQDAGGGARCRQRHRPAAVAGAGGRVGSAADTRRRRPGARGFARPCHRAAAVSVSWESRTRRLWQCSRASAA